MQIITIATILNKIVIHRYRDCIILILTFNAERVFQPVAAITPNPMEQGSTKKMRIAHTQNTPPLQ